MRLISSIGKGKAVWLAITLVGLVILAVVGVGTLLLAKDAKTASSTDVNAAIEQRWGIRVTQVGVTADGGLVDFRYLVVDADKALAMIQDVNNLPVLVDEAKGSLVNSAAMMPAKHALNPGQTYFLLYRNSNGSIKHNSEISVVFGDLRLQHFAVK